METVAMVTGVVMLFMLMVSMKKQDVDSTFAREDFCCVE